MASAAVTNKPLCDDHDAARTGRFTSGSCLTKGCWAFKPSFPNSVWERRWPGNSVATPAKQSLEDKYVPKQSLGTRSPSTLPIFKIVQFGPCGMGNLLNLNGVVAEN